MSYVEEIDRLKAEVLKLRAEVADYREGINWGTSCLNCSSALTSNYHQYVRAELAEAERDRARDLAAHLEEELAPAYAVFERVRALHPGHGHAPDGKTWTHSCLAGCGPWPCPTVALLPEATS